MNTNKCRKCQKINVKRDGLCHLCFLRTVFYEKEYKNIKEHIIFMESLGFKMSNNIMVRVKIEEFYNYEDITEIKNYWINLPFFDSWNNAQINTFTFYPSLKAEFESCYRPFNDKESGITKTLIETAVIPISSFVFFD